MALKNVMIEYRHTPELQQAFAMSLRDPRFRTVEALRELPRGIQLDYTYPTVPVPSEEAAAEPVRFLSALALAPVAPPDMTSFLARGIYR